MRDFDRGPYRIVVVDDPTTVVKQIKLSILAAIVGRIIAGSSFTPPTGKVHNPVDDRAKKVAIFGVTGVL